MSSVRKRKRNYGHSSDSSEGGQEDEERTYKAAKVDHKVPQSEHNSPGVRLPILQLIALLRLWSSSVARKSACSCMLTES